jgi:hypothetical protein
MFARNLGEDSRRFAGHVVEVRCLTADHGTERHERLVSSAPRARFCGDSKLEAPGTWITSTAGVLDAASRQAARAPSSSLPVTRSCTGSPGLQREAAWSVGEEMAEQVPLGVEIAAVFRIDVGLERDALGDLESVRVESHHLPRIVRHQADGGEAQVAENLGSDAVIPEIGREARAAGFAATVSSPESWMT